MGKEVNQELHSAPKSGFLKTRAKLLRKPSTGQGTAEEELFAWVVSGPSIGCWCSSLVIAHYGSQIASNSAGVDQY